VREGFYLYHERQSDPSWIIVKCQTQAKKEISRREGATLGFAHGWMRWRCVGVGGTHSRGDVGGQGGHICGERGPHTKQMQFTTFPHEEGAQIPLGA
jgi:hypothetical protein